MDFTVDDIFISADHPCFAGHFPDHPVFPAVAQIDLVLDLLSRNLGQSCQAMEISKARFPAPIAPNSYLSVRLQVSDNRVVWQISSSGRICSSGQLSTCGSRN